MLVIVSYICIRITMCMNSESTDRDTLNFNSIDEFLSALHRPSSNEDSGIIRSNTTIEL